MIQVVFGCRILKIELNEQTNNQQMQLINQR